MSPWKSTIAGGIRKALPLNSSRRLFAAATYYSIKDARAFLRNVRANYVRAAGTARTSELEYRTWRKQNVHHIPDQALARATRTTFAVIVEIDPQDAVSSVERTRASVERQLGRTGSRVSLRTSCFSCARGLRWHRMP